MKRILNLFLSLSMCLTLLPTVKTVQAKDDGQGKIYYVDSKESNPNGDGLSPENAFNSLEQVNNKLFQPGDKILLKSGSEFNGTLYPKGSGSEGYPIVISSYGEGDKPKINGDGATFMPQKKDWKGPFTGDDGKQIGAAVYLYNQEYIEISNLDVRNPGANIDADRSGIRVEGYNKGVLRHIYIRNCNVHDVKGYNGQDDIYPVVPTDEDGKPLDGYVGGDQQNPNTSNTFWGARTTHRTGGINFVTYTARKPEAKNKYNVLVQERDDTKKITTFDDIRIENNKIENCQANGITTTNVKGELDDVKYRHTNVVIRNNYIHNVTRAGIIPLYTSGALVEYNKVDTFQSTTAGYGCGIWCDRANGMIFQFNEVCNGQNGNDGMAFNLDDMTRDGIVQYNYTHDNYGGGYMLHVRQKSYNRNNTIRYNLSINDSGVYANHNAQIVAVGETDITKLESAKVYNNTFISNKDCHAVYQGDQVDYNNNIWYFTNPATANRNDSFKPGANSTFDNNAYIGVKAPLDEHAANANPQFAGGDALFKLNKEDAYAAAALQNTSPYIAKGIRIASDLSKKDILGRDISKSNNLGAFGGIGHMKNGNPIATEYKADKVKRYMSDGTLQSEIIHETATEANAKWVDTSFNEEPVVYTKKLGNYIEIPFTGTGGILKLKRGGGAGKVKAVVYKADDLQNAVKEVSVNSYHASADIFAYDGLKDISADNQEYVLRILNDENGKASNFMSFTSEVDASSTPQTGCENDEITSIQLEKPEPLVIPFGADNVSVTLRSHVFMDTCDPVDVSNIPVTYKATNGAVVKDNVVTFTKEGSYEVSATASYGEKSVTTSIMVEVGTGKKPQVNVPAVHTRALENLVDICASLDMKNYALDGQEAFIAKLSEATALLTNDKATQAEVDAMVKALNDAKDALYALRYDAEDSAVVKEGNWITISDTSLDKGTALKSGVANETMSLTFKGNNISVYGRKAVGTGIAKFTITKIDGDKEEVQETKEVNCYSADKKDKQVLYEWSTSQNGTYRIDVMNTGKKDGSTDINTIIDYFTIGVAVPLDKTAINEAIKAAQAVNLDMIEDNDAKTTLLNDIKQAIILVNEATAQKELDDFAAKLNADLYALTGKNPLKVEAESDVVEKVGDTGWGSLTGTGISGSEIKTDIKGNQAILSFTGSGIQVIGRKAVGTGIVKFSLYKGDTLVMEPILSDTYQEQTEDGAVLFAWYGEQGDYRLVCENTGTWNTNSNGSNNMILDFFHVLRVPSNPVDNSELQSLIEKADKLKEQEYTTESWSNFTKALKAAKEINEKDTATKEEVMQAQTHLDAAMKALKKVETPVQPDKSELQSLIGKADKLKEQEYTTESWSNFTKALKAAKEINEKDTATKEEVMQAQTHLDVAMKALKKVETPIRDTTKDHINNDKNNDVVDTGDSTNETVIAMLGFILLAGGAILLLGKFKVKSIKNR